MYCVVKTITIIITMSLISFTKTATCTGFSLSLLFVLLIYHYLIMGSIMLSENENCTCH